MYHLENPTMWIHTTKIHQIYTTLVTNFKFTPFKTFRKARSVLPLNIHIRYPQRINNTISIIFFDTGLLSGDIVPIQDTHHTPKYNYILTHDWDQVLFHAFVMIFTISFSMWICVCVSSCVSQMENCESVWYLSSGNGVVIIKAYLVVRTLFFWIHRFVLNRVLF